MLLQGISLDQVYLNLALKWEVDLLAENPKQKKSIWDCFIALDKFSWLLQQDILDGFILASYAGKPAIELGFRISFPDGFRYRGFVDAVLYHPTSGKVKVLEIKTTSSRALHPAQYSNSAQAIGYSIVLDHIFPDISHYEVLYMPYKTVAREFDPMPFNKSLSQRALWIRELLLDIEVIKMYAAADVFPMRGESCYNFYRECSFYNMCTLSTERLAAPLPEEPKVETFDVELTIQDLINSQLRNT